MSKKGVIGIILVLVLVAGVIIIDVTTAVRPEWPEAREGDPIPSRPGPDDAPFHREPFAPTFEARRAAFLEWISRQETPESRSGVWTDLAKLEYDPEYTISAIALQDSLDFVNEHNDTADFHMAGLMRLYHKHADSGSTYSNDGCSPASDVR